MARIILSLAFLSLFLMLLNASGAEIIGPDARVTNDEIVVSTGLALDEKNVDDLKNGISKEITFYIDLFRVWRMWPNEFIAGKKIVKTLRSDPIKKEYTATTFDGATLTEKRFKRFDSMLDWTLTIKDLKLINIKELQSSDYYVKVTVESRLRELPPVIGYLLFFVSEKDFKLSKESPSLSTGTEK
ncbi:MAG TPA: DUF4390 domain-containing protein [Thermodesulfovibrionales bacterium]|nr:DUF4390 domain-containing protein [Thermodesulfovibrionales bacterium]